MHRGVEQGRSPQLLREIGILGRQAPERSMRHDPHFHLRQGGDRVVEHMQREGVEIDEVARNVESNDLPGALRCRRCSGS